MPERKHIRTFRSKKLHPEHVKLLNNAIRKNAKGGDHSVKITYRKESGEVSERRIKPLGVKQKDLLLAHCHERNAVRSFKIGRISKMEKSAFWDGFFKKAMDHSEYIKEMDRTGKSWESSGRKMRLAYLGVPAAIAAAMKFKNPIVRGGAAVAGIGSGLVGYSGERGMGYGKGVQTISKYLGGKEPSTQEWDHLIKNNPSGSLMKHVHPDHRLQLAKKWSGEHKRFWGNKE